MRHHRAALITISAAVVIDSIGGLAFASVEHLSAGVGLYWAVATGTTTGYGDVSPHTAAGHWIAVAVMVTAIPLVTATFSLFSAGLVAAVMRRDKRETKKHAEDMRDEIKEHVARLMASKE